MELDETYKRIISIVGNARADVVTDYDYIKSHFDGFYFDDEEFARRLERLVVLKYLDVRRGVFEPSTDRPKGVDVRTKGERKNTSRTMAFGSNKRLKDLSSIPVGSNPIDKSKWIEIPKVG